MGTSRMHLDIEGVASWFRQTEILSRKIVSYGVQLMKGNNVRVLPGMGWLGNWDVSSELTLQDVTGSNNEIIDVLSWWINLKETKDQQEQTLGTMLTDAI